MCTDQSHLPVFRLSNPWAFTLYGMPLRCSVPFPLGQVNNPAAELVLIDVDGGDCKAQWRVLSTWADDSARFALMDFAEPQLPPRTSRRYQLKRKEEEVDAGNSQTAITLSDTQDALTIDTGRLAWTFSKKRFSLGMSLHFNGRDWLQGQASDLYILNMQGSQFRASEGDYRISLEERGEHRVIVRVDGNHGRGAERCMDYTLRFHFTAGGSQVLMLHHLRNRHGGREGRRFRRCWLEGSLDFGEDTVRRILHTQRGLMTMQEMVVCPERVDLDTDAWPKDITPDPFRFPRAESELTWSGPFTVIRNGDSLREKDQEICYSIHEKNPDKACGDRRCCEPLIDLHSPGIGGMLFKFAMAKPHLEYPLHLGSEGSRFEIDFFSEWREPHHFGEGMGKTRDVLFNFHDDSLDAMDVYHESANLSYPGVVSAGTQAYRGMQFADMHRTMPFLPNRYPLLESKIDLFRMAQHGRCWPPAMGWKHYGDEFGHRGGLQRQNVWQTINNEEDYLWCCMIDGWRRGQAYGGLSMARHIMDIDYIDYSDDPARNGATCPHSEQHTNGEVYPSHQWCQGLLYFYLATGDEEALRISKRIGDCLHWWITGPHRRAMRFSGRETAWPLLSLSALYEATHETRYRDAALKVVDDLIAIQQQHGQVCWEYPPNSGIYSSTMLTMTFNGIWDVWAATGERRVLQLWKDLTQPVVARLEDPDNWGYVVFRNWQIKVADLTVLARWYELTGDEKYIRLGKNGLRLILSAAPQLESQFQGFFAMWYRHIILYLKYADECGMIDDDHCTLVW